jgi:hypothetical protein
MPTALLVLFARSGAWADSTPRSRSGANPDRAAGESAECREARRDWSEGAEAARASLAGLQACLAGGVPPCGADLAAVRSVVAEITAHEQRIGWLCGGRP